MARRHHLLRTTLFVLPIVLILLVAACGGSSDTSVSPQTTASEQVSNPTVVPSPESDSTSETTPASAKPTTETIPPMVEGFIYDKYGFTLRLDEEIDINSLGWTDSTATANQGLLSFVYNGTNVLVLWMHGTALTATDMLADIYQTLRLVQPDSAFVPISEGSIEVANVEGLFGGFAISDSSSASVGGGLIGTWICVESDTAMGLTVIGSNATTLQVRFNRLLQGMEC